MDWERINKKLNMFMFCLLVTVFGLSMTVQAYTPYSNGNISSTYITYFDDIINNYPLSDYVIWRDTQYNYCLAVGNLKLTNTTISGENVKLYTIDTNYQYNQSYTLTESSVSEFHLYNQNNYLIYSNLGYYPNCTERGSIYEYAVLFILITVCLFYLCRDIFRTGASR